MEKIECARCNNDLKNNNTGLVYKRNGKFYHSGCYKEVVLSELDDMSEESLAEQLNDDCWELSNIY